MRNDKNRPESHKEEVEIPCPICGKRICDAKGEALGTLEVELKCSGNCGFVWVNIQHMLNFLTKKS